MDAENRSMIERAIANNSHVIDGARQQMAEVLSNCHEYYHEGEIDKVLFECGDRAVQFLSYNEQLEMLLDKNREPSQHDILCDRLFSEESPS